MLETSDFHLRSFSKDVCEACAKGLLVVDCFQLGRERKTLRVAVVLSQFYAAADSNVNLPLYIDLQVLLKLNLSKTQRSSVW